MSIGSLKLVLMVAILVSGWIGGLVPLRKASLDSPRFLSFGNAFAAGIFLGIGMIHMLPDASATWRDSLGFEYPLALLLAGGAFLVLLGFEHVALPSQVQEPADVIADLNHDTTPHTRLYPYALIVALSVHSVIAGVALGAQQTTANVVLLFFAIVAHKSTAAFALGVSLARNRIPRRRAVKLVGVFATMTPIGIVIGLLISNALEGRAQAMFDAVFLSLAAGTFIYIAIFDIIRDEFLQPGPRTAKWMLAATGYGLMAVLALWL